LARRRRFSTEPFGPTLERLMQEKGVTYRALAEQTSLSAGYLNHLVHGNRPVPSDEIVRKLSKALGVEPEHFREYRLRLITQKLEQLRELIDRLYRRLER
jgi:transcriptional regulator with XRE-family HTH domain